MFNEYKMIPDIHAQQIKTFLGLKPEESIVIIGDNTTQEIVLPLYQNIRDSHNSSLINLDYFRRPLSIVPEELVDEIKGKDVCFYAIDKKANSSINELLFRRALNNLVEENGGRIGNMLSVTPFVVESAFSYDANKIKDLTERIHDYMQNTKAVRVITSEGTNAVFEFDDCYKWCQSTGFIQKGKTRNVMPAEVYTHPANVNGTIAITGTYGLLGSLEQFKDYQQTLDRIKTSPILWVVENGKIKSVDCKDKEIEEIVREQVFESDVNSDRIGEYGMGTNIGIRKCLGIMMHDEKYPGVHVAHGHGYPKETGAKYDCKTHFDGVLLEPNIVDLCNGRVIMDKGNYRF
jgi:aminopeptidase